MVYLKSKKFGYEEEEWICRRAIVAITYISWVKALDVLDIFGELFLTEFLVIPRTTGRLTVQMLK